MELLIQHRKSVVEEQKKWAEYLQNLDEKISIYQDRISGKSEEFCGRKRYEP
ncbi:MAG: hypothetical protein Q4C77_13640 [Eubacteriales bacterium]|nr:hypothetical protein [Eubacteriales bacterium]